MSAPTTTDTLLDWAFSPSPDPAQAGRPLALRFVATVPVVRKRVRCERVTFAFDVEEPPPEDGTYLTCEGTGIGVMAEPADQWELEASHADGTFTFVRPPGVPPEVTTSYTFVIHGIAVSHVVGTAEVTVRESSSQDDADAYGDRTRTFAVRKFPPELGEVEFTTDRTHVEPDGIVNLTWKGDADADYTLSYAGESVDLTNERPPWTSPKLRHDTGFTLTVSRAQDGRTVDRRYYLAVFVDAPSVSLMGDRYTICRGEAVKLSWRTDHVTDCRLTGPGAPGRLTIDPPLEVRPRETGRYVLSGRTRSGHFVQDAFDVSVAQSAPAAGPDLVFIKTAFPAGAAGPTDKVVLHVLEGASGYQKLWASVTAFDAAEGSNGVWTIAPYTLDRTRRDLVFIKTRETASGQVEVHHCTGASNYQQGDRVTSGAPASLASKGRWLAVKMSAARRDDSADLVLVESEAHSMNEALSSVAVHAWAFESGFGAMVEGAPWSVHFARHEALNGTLLFAYMDADGGQHPPDLVFVKTSHTDSGNVELSYATGASRYQSIAHRFVTGFATDDAALGTWQLADMNADGRLDLVFIKTENTQSEHVELYWALAADEYTKPVGGFTFLSAADARNGTWQLVSVA